jgi:hypothetical protein
MMMMIMQRSPMKEIISKHAIKFAKHAEEHEKFINKVSFSFFHFNSWFINYYARFFSIHYIFLYVFSSLILLEFLVMVPSVSF